MRALVAIANHGTDKADFVEKLLACYRSFPVDVDVVVLSDQPKEVAPDVEVLVGAPGPNPYTLPFAHRRLFTERRDDYDLFIYSEDDTLFEPQQLSAWLELQSLLPDDTVCGFVRYELDAEGRRSYSSFHSGFHWDTTSVRRHGSELFASYSNDHAALYVLTRPQLHRAIASGNYDRPPHRGRYALLEMAASGLFLDCGLRRVLPLDHLPDLALHHLPDRYLGVMGVDDAALRRQVEALRKVHDGELRAGQLFPTTTGIDHFGFDKSLYEPASPAILDAVPSGARSILCVGGGMGTLEPALAERAPLTVVPLDAVVQHDLTERGIEATTPDLDSALAELAGRSFDVVVLPDVVPHVARPEAWLQRLRSVMAVPCTVVATAPDHLWLGMRGAYRQAAQHPAFKRYSNSGPRPLVRGSFDRNQLHATTRRWMIRTLTSAGCQQVVAVREEQRGAELPSDRSRFELNRLLPSHVVVRGVVS